MSKVHLQGNAGVRREPMAMCSTQITGKGKVVNNGRRSYVRMASEIVRFEQFKATPAADRCAHCCDVLLHRRNLQRKLAGKPPVRYYNEGWDQ